MYTDGLLLLMSSLYIIYGCHIFIWNVSFKLCAKNVVIFQSHEEASSLWITYYRIYEHSLSSQKCAVATYIYIIYQSNHLVIYLYLILERKYVIM